MKKNGITLIELLLTLTLLGVMAVIVMGTISLSKIMFNRNISQATVQSNLKAAIDIMVRDLQEAQKGIDSGCGNFYLPNNVCIVTSAGSHANLSPATKGLSFLVPDSTNLEGVTSYKTIAFQWYEANADAPEYHTITRKEVDGSGTVINSQTIGRDIETFEIINDSANDPDIITIKLTRKARYDKISASLTAQIFLRNSDPDA